MGPALAAGNTVVIKPSEITPLSTLQIGELMMKAGIPPGVVNIVPGYGNTAGQRIAEHPGIGKVSFTGSTNIGRSIVRASAGNLKKVQLELGGKGPNIVFDDANIPAAVGGSAFAIFHNQGQACIAGSRLILHENDRRPIPGPLHRAGPLDPAWRSARYRNRDGAPDLASIHHERVLSYVDLVETEGGKILTGGKAPGGRRWRKGFFVEPTIVAGEPGASGVAEEVFGPFVSATMFKDEAEAVAIANGTDYGLGAGTLDARCPARATASPRISMPAWSGSTAISGCTRPRRLAASASRATAARWASRRCANTPRRNRFGSMSMPIFRPSTNDRNV